MAQPEIRDEFVTTLHPVIRVVLAASGALALCAPVLALWRGLWPLNALTPFFLVIVLGSASVGLAFILGAIRTSETRWQIMDRLVRIESHVLWRRRTFDITGNDVADLAIREIEWDMAPSTWAVRLALRSGEVFETPDYGKRAMAETKKAALAAALGLEQT